MLKPLSNADLSRSVQEYKLTVLGLRRNLPKVRETSVQKPFTEIIYIVLETSVRLF